jgi:hypothetical protein
MADLALDLGRADGFRRKLSRTIRCQGFDRRALAFWIVGGT